jgi:hypothetical protein
VAKSPTLKVDGGAPPVDADQDPDRVDELEPGAVHVDLGGAADELEPGWSRETLRSLVAVPFLALHLLERRRGPADAWLPDDGELDVMATPLYNLVVRSVRLRPLARYGDGVAFTAATGTYVAGESRRIALWRVQHADGGEPAPDADVAHLFTRPAEQPPPSRHDEPPRPSGPPPIVVDDVRPWRPPSVPNQ